METSNKDEILNIKDKTFDLFLKNTLNFEGKSRNNSIDKRETLKNITKTGNQIRTFKKNKNKYLNKGDYEVRPLLKMNRVFDSCDEDEHQLDAEPFILIEIESNFKKIWESLMLMTIFYSSYISPLNYCFELSIIFEIIDIIIEIALILDIFLSLITQTEDDQEKILSSSIEIFENYILNWFVLDLITCFPASFFLLIFHKNLILEYLKWFGLLRLLKLIKYPFLTKLKFHQDTEIDNMLKNLLCFSVFIHILTCFYIYIGMISSTNNNWIVSYNIQNRFDIYFASLTLHLGLIFTVGFAGLEPKNISEKFYSIIIIFFAMFIFPLTIISISKFMIDENSDQIKFYQKTNYFKKISKKYFLKKDLKTKVFNSLNLEHEKKFLLREDFFNSLPVDTRLTLNNYIYKSSISKLEIFSNKSYDFVLSMIPLLRYKKPAKGETLMNIGVKVDEMYIVMKGRLSLRLGPEYSSIEVFEILANKYFGDIFLHTNTNSPFELRNKSHQTQLFSIIGHDFAKIKNRFQKIFIEILENSIETIELINKRKRKIIQMFQSEKTEEKVKLMLRYFNHYIFNRDFESYYYKDKEMENQNDFLINNKFDHLKKIFRRIKMSELKSRKGLNNQGSFYKEMKTLIASPIQVLAKESDILDVKLLVLPKKRQVSRKQMRMIKYQNLVEKLHDIISKNDLDINEFIKELKFGNRMKNIIQSSNNDNINEENPESCTTKLNTMRGNENLRIEYFGFEIIGRKNYTMRTNFQRDELIYKKKSYSRNLNEFRSNCKSNTSNNDDNYYDKVLRKLELIFQKIKKKQ